MQPTMQALLGLQQIDRKLYRVESELERLPAELAKRQGELDALLERATTLNNQVLELRRDTKEVEDFTTGMRQRQRKLESESAKGKIDAAMLASYEHEIRSLKRGISEAEDEALRKMGAAETRRAIEAAEEAQKEWRKLTGKERAAILRKWHDLMMASQEDLAVLMTTEQGKPITESRGEIAYAAAFIEWFAEEGKRVYGDTIPGHTRDTRIVVMKEPIGVTAAITPWNFPAAMITARRVRRSPPVAPWW